MLIVLLTSWASLNDPYDHCSVWDSESIQNWSYFLYNGPEKVYKTYAANWKGDKMHVKEEDLPKVICTLIYIFMKKGVLLKKCSSK